ncbi:wdr4, partial [Symbiodinium sp. CCMP2592]
MAQKPPVSLPLLPLSLHPTRSTAVWAVGRFLFAYDLQLGTWQVRRRELHGEAIRALHAYTLAAGKTVWLSAGDDKMVMTWTEEGGDWELQHSFSNPKKITAALFDKDGRVVFGDRFGDVLRWVPGEGDAQLLSSHFAMVTAMAFTPSGSYLVVGDNHEKVRVSRYPETADIRSFCFGHTSQITAVSTLCLDGQERLLSASADATLRLWTLDGEECKSWKLPAAVSSLSFGAGSAALGIETLGTGLGRVSLTSNEVEMLLPE